MQKSKNYFFIYVIVLLILGSFIIGIFVGRSDYVQDNMDSQNGVINKYSAQTDKVDFKLFWDAWDLVEKKFIDQPLDYQKMVYGAISGMLASLDDPYTNFMDPETTENFKDEIEGSFEGIGAEIGIKNDTLTIVAPLSNSPAEKAGLRPHDKILKIDNQETDDMSLIEAVYLIRGEKGTDVTLTIAREGEELKDYVIIRDQIDVKSVEWKEISLSNGEKIALIELSYFGEDTANELKKASAEILKLKPKGIILDLRNNAGGYLESSIDVASMFVDDNQTIAYQVTGDGEEKEFKSNGGGSLSSIPLVILINNGSASASEIVAGAMRDIRSSKLIGEKSFGKGSVQELEFLPGGSSIRITIAKWLTPNKQNINGEGINPDIEVELSEEDYNKDKDPQLNKAKEIIKNK